jgi:hypothetical protein
MFIREKIKRRKGKEYIQHQLIESVRTAAGPRQNIILNMGKLDIEQNKWKLLANAIEEKLHNQPSLFNSDPDIKKLAQHYAQLIIHNRLSRISEREEIDSSEKIEDVQSLLSGCWKILPYLTYLILWNYRLFFTVIDLKSNLYIRHSLHQQKGMANEFRKNSFCSIKGISATTSVSSLRKALSRGLQGKDFFMFGSIFMSSLCSVNLSGKSTGYCNLSARDAQQTLPYGHPR